MALATTNAENQALAGVLASGSPTNLMAFGTLHSASPGTTGANEMTGGGYARVAATWNTPSGGSVTNASSEAYTTNGTTPVTHMDGNSASTAGTFGVGMPLTSSVTAASITAAAGSRTLTAA